MNSLLVNNSAALLEYHVPPRSGMDQSTIIGIIFGCLATLIALVGLVIAWRQLQIAASRSDLSSTLLLGGYDQGPHSSPGPVQHGFEITQTVPEDHWQWNLVWLQIQTNV
ncbi:hypothetical protein EDB80DRAFT_870318 [Ilyonectria destructans]|nr:hypothetical protein EDB80DRAFT_870318 [Ilyonectria destructans]